MTLRAMMEALGHCKDQQVGGTIENKINTINPIGTRDIFKYNVIFLDPTATDPAKAIVRTQETPAAEKQ